MMKRRSLMPLLASAAGLNAAGKAARAQSDGWTPLFNGRDFTGWDRIGDANWRVEEGVLIADRGNGFLVSQQDYRDFQLRAEFFVDSITNSGIYIRCTNPAMVSTANAYEVNIWDERPEPRFGTGAIVDLAAVDRCRRRAGAGTSSRSPPPAMPSRSCSTGRRPPMPSGMPVSPPGGSPCSTAQACRGPAAR
jgi:hypothetical protein